MHINYSGEIFFLTKLSLHTLTEHSPSHILISCILSAYTSVSVNELTKLIIYSSSCVWCAPARVNVVVEVKVMKCVGLVWQLPGETGIKYDCVCKGMKNSLKIQPVSTQTTCTFRAGTWTLLGVRRMFLSLSGLWGEFRDMSPFQLSHNPGSLWDGG